MHDPNRRDFFETGPLRLAWTVGSILGPAWFAFRIAAGTGVTHSDLFAMFLQSKEAILGLAYIAIFLVEWPLFKFMRRMERAGFHSLPWPHGMARGFGKKRVVYVLCAVGALAVHFLKIPMPLWLWGLPALFWAFNVFITAGLLIREPQLRAHAARCTEAEGKKGLV